MKASRIMILMVLMVGMTFLGAAQFSPSDAGTEEWTYDYGDLVWGVAVEDGNVYAGGSANEVVKLDSSGNEEWTYDYGDSVYGVSVDSDGNVYAGGYGEHDVVKLDSSGNEEWTYDYGNTVRGVSVDSDGNVYAGGYANEVVKLDSSGNEEWTYDYGESVWGVAVEDGNVYAAGDANEVVKLDSSGNEEWSYNYGDPVRGVAVEEGDVYAGGSANEVVKLDSSGNEEWSYNYGDPVQSVAVDSDENVYAGGSANEVVKLTFNQPPSIDSSSVSPDPPVLGEASDVSYNVSDDTEVNNVTVEWFYDGVEQNSTTRSYSSASVTDTVNNFYTPENEGNHTIYFTAVDDQGASSTTSIEREVTQDLPNIPSFTNPGEGQTYSYASDQSSADIQFDWEVTWDSEFSDGVTEIQVDDGSGFSTEASINQAASGTQTYSENISLSEGSYDVRVYAEQNSGADTTTSETRSITVSQDTEAQSITLSSPNDGASFGYGPSESGAEVDFEWFVEAYEEDGTTRLYVNDVEKSSQGFASMASNSFNYSETFTEGTYEYYVTANSESNDITSPTRTFTVEQQDIDVDFSLTEPSNNKVYNTGFGTDQTVNYEGGVSSDTSGTINLIRDGQTLATESHPGSASVPISATEDLGAGLYEWLLEFEYESTEQQDTIKTVDFEDDEVDPFDVFAETVPTSNVLLESTDAINGTNSLYVKASSSENIKTYWNLEDDSDIDITTVENISFTTNTYELQSVTDTAWQYNVFIENQGNEDIAELEIDDDFENNELDLVWEGVEGDTVLLDNIGGQDLNIDLLFDEANMQVEVIVNGNSQGTFELDTADTSLNIAEINVEMDKTEDSTNDGNGALFDDFQVDHVTDQTVTETITSNSNSFEVVEEEAQDAVINLNNPNDGEVLNLDPGVTSGEVTFDWGVEGYDETGNTTLYINDSQAFNDSFASFASNPYSYTENLSVGSYDYYVEASTATTTVTSPTRTFTVNEQDMARPEFGLTKPEDNAELYVDGATSGEVDFEFGVSAETDGNLFLEVADPGTTNYTDVYNTSVTGLTSESFNTSQEFTGIDYNQEYNGFNETEEYNWRLRFESTETDDEFTSTANSFTFTEEKVTTADSVSSGIIGFFGDYWEAFIDGTSDSGKAFIGLILMLLVGGIGFALAGSTGAGLGMVTMFFMNTVLGLFPGWIALAIIISILGYIFVFRGE